MDTDYLDYVRSGVFLIEGFKMDKDLFNKKADMFAKHFVKTFGCEYIDKLDFFAPMAGEYWQFKYVAQPKTNKK